MGLWLSITQEEPECEPCYDVDDAPTCREEVDLVNDYMLHNEEALKSSIMGLLNAKTTLEQGDEAISVFRDKQTMVDATRRQMRVAMYEKDGTFMVRDGDRCLTANGDAAFYKCGLGAQQMWAEEDGKLKSAATGECVDNAMKMAPCDKTGLHVVLSGNRIRVGKTNSDMCIVKGEALERKARPTSYMWGKYTKTMTRYDGKNKGGFFKKTEKKEKVNVDPYCSGNEKLQPLKGRPAFRCVNGETITKHKATLGECATTRATTLFVNKVSQEVQTVWCPDDQVKSSSAECSFALPPKDVPAGEAKMRTYEDVEKEVLPLYTELKAYNKETAKRDWDLKNRARENERKMGGAFDPSCVGCDRGPLESFDLHWECFMEEEYDPDPSRVNNTTKPPKCEVFGIRGNVGLGDWFAPTANQNQPPMFSGMIM